MSAEFIVPILFFNNLINFCLQNGFYDKVIGFRPGVRKTHLAFILPAGAALLTYTMILGEFSIFSVMIIILPYPILILRGRIKERVLFAFVSCVMVQFANLLSLSVISNDMLWNMDEYIQPVPFLLSGILTNLVYTILASSIIHFDSKGKEYLPKKYWSGILIVMSIVFTAVTGIFTFGAWLNETVLDVYVIACTLGLLIMSLLLYFVFYLICKYFYLANEANLLNAQNEMLEKILQHKRTADERINILSHDLKHSLIEWRTLAIEKNDDNALRSITEYEEQLAKASLVDIGNENANAIINHKALEAYQENVEFVVDGLLYPDLMVNKLDLHALLGNLLDNAIEAAAQVEEKQKRRVKLMIRRKGNILILQVENGYSIEPVIRNGIFLTTKKDKELHAIGMTSIRCIAEKYHGTVTNTYAMHWFKAAVMMMGYENTLSDKN